MDKNERTNDIYPRDTIREIVAFWKSGTTKKRTLKSVQHRYRKVSSMTTLIRWDKQIQKGRKTNLYKTHSSHICFECDILISLTHFHFILINDSGSVVEKRQKIDAYVSKRFQEAQENMIQVHDKDLSQRIRQMGLWLEEKAWCFFVGDQTRKTERTEIGYQSLLNYSIP